ncbi:DUF4129 domain-containing protein [Halosimplex salinum]|uniref:DUF4129 domain-containing protein n=1 Tax=Halosimplex salinum TaxID=1710538 RepID=UPI000F48E138|nr:DUF4129 domain-containing protein [Halosimplex salinum]
MADRLVAALVVVLCVLALAFAASSLSASTPSRGLGEGDASGSSDLPEAQPTPANATTEDPPGLPANWVAIVVAAFVALGLPALFFLGRDRTLGILAGGALVLLIVGALMFFAGSGFDQSVPSFAENVSAGAQGGGDLGGSEQSQSDRSRDLPTLVTFGVVGLALLAAVGIVAYASASVDASVDPERTTDPEPEPEEWSGVAEAAGRAADRMERESDTSNAVYEAWREMTAALDGPDPDTATPGEFAAAAVDAGMAEDRVADLTDLFEQVRYGDEPVTAERERHAVETLRAIEADHGSVDASVADRDGDSSADASTDPDGDSLADASTDDGDGQNPGERS